MEKNYTTWVRKSNRELGSTVPIQMAEFSREEQMRIKQTVSTIAVLAVVSAIGIATERTARSQNIHSDSLSGSYAISIRLNCPTPSTTTPPCAPGPYPGYVTYSSSGSAIANEILPYPGPLSTATLTEDHGNWAKVGGTNTFAVTFEKLASSGQVALATVRNRAIIHKQGETFSGQFVTDVGSPAGTNFTVVGTGTISGQFIAVDLKPQF